MLRYDTVFGRFPKSLDHDQSGIYIDGKHVDVFSCSDALEIPWKEAGVDYVIDCTGAYVTTEKAMDHIEAGAKQARSMSLFPRRQRIKIHQPSFTA